MPHKIGIWRNGNTPKVYENCPIFEGDPVNELAEQLRVEGRGKLRACFHGFHQLSRARDGIIAFSAQYPLFLELCGAELLGQLVASGYENVRVNKSVFLQAPLDSPA